MRRTGGRWQFKSPGVAEIYRMLLAITASFWIHAINIINIVL